MKQKLKYLFACTTKNIRREGFSCPSCGCSNATVVSRKYLVTALRRCESCQLLFRTPTTNPEENASFYQEEYTQGFTTDCPSEDVLSQYLERGFSGGEKDYSNYIDIVPAKREVVYLILVAHGDTVAGNSHKKVLMLNHLRFQRREQTLRKASSE